MKKLLVPLLLILTLAAGIAFARRTSKPTHIPRTITYLQTERNVDGTLFRSVTVVRKVTASGWWTHTTPAGVNDPDDCFAKGQLPAVPTTPLSAELPRKQFLGYEVVVIPSKVLVSGVLTVTGEVWYSPDLDELLKMVKIDKNGIEEFKSEATDIQLN
ncbi:MAG: hypothetical protein DMF69_20560 [Acidobacteria bacterium]|nr:MAG: hypothetical protein DMF69_20560 [Acidobacteriota bacterium]